MMLALAAALALAAQNPAWTASPPPLSDSIHETMAQYQLFRAREPDRGE